MEALNIEAEYRKYVRAAAVPDMTQAEYAQFQVADGTWVEDDGDYYTAEEWDSQYAEDDGPAPSCGCGAAHWVHMDLEQEQAEVDNYWRTGY